MDDVQQLTGTVADSLRTIGHELTSLGCCCNSA